MKKIFILKQCENKHIGQIEAAKQLGITTRQVRRLQKCLKEEGLVGIKSKHKGGNRKIKDDFKNEVMNIVKEKYNDFGPTFASEKLEENHGYKISKETLRGWMIEASLWKGRKRKSARIHQSRDRRPRYGELVQIDGSHHDWFEGRASKCCLYVFIDDATSKIITMRFESSETTFGYMKCIQTHLETYGKPLAYYSDRHSIFKTTRTTDGIYEETQLYRAFRELGIELICAHSPQAKGRVERANKTLQDRLIKEMRLRHISTIEEANIYLSEFIHVHNAKFSVPPQNTEDAHRPVCIQQEKLQRILSYQETRTLSKNLECRYKGKVLQVQSAGGGYHLRHAQVLVCQHLDGHMEIIYKDKLLTFKEQEIQTKPVLMGDRKDLDSLFETNILHQKKEVFLSVQTGHF